MSCLALQAVGRIHKGVGHCPQGGLRRQQPLFPQAVCQAEGTDAVLQNPAPSQRMPQRVASGHQQQRIRGADPGRHLAILIHAGAQEQPAPQLLMSTQLRRRAAPQVPVTYLSVHHSKGLYKKIGAICFLSDFCCCQALGACTALCSPLPTALTGRASLAQSNMIFPIR